MSSTTPKAVLTAQEVYDLPGDLSPHQQAFLSAVHQITTTSAEVKRQSIEKYGYGSAASIVRQALAEAKELDDLADALAKYEQALEDK